jgi:hypothetical protein
MAMLSESYHSRGPGEYLSKWRGKIPSWLSMSRSLFLSRTELWLYNCLITEQSLTEPKSADPQLGSYNNLMSKDYIDRDMQMMTLLIASHCRSVRLAKHISRARVIRISVTIPMTSGTESSAELHISLSHVSNTTSMTKDNLL